VKLRPIFLFLLSSLIPLVSCTETDTTATSIPLTSAIAELESGCEWKTETLHAFQDKKSVVSFRHQICGNEKYTSFSISENGTSINKVEFDLVTDGFHIFKRTEKPIDVFIMNLPQSVHKVGENCHPKKVTDKLWIIEDNLDPNTELSRLPCGRYGRTSWGQTIFEIKGDIILNYGTYSTNGGIDKSSIKFTKRLSK